MHLRRPSSLAALLLVALLPGCLRPDRGRGDVNAAAFLALAAAEDARPTGGADLETLLDGTRAHGAALRAEAVRGLGRLENPALRGAIAPLLDDPDAAVRGEAANALAQAVSRGSGDAVEPLLVERIASEPDPWVRGILARSLGRLNLDQDSRDRVARVLLSLTRSRDGGAVPVDQIVGTALGLASFTRGTRNADLRVGDATEARLLELMRYAGTGGDSVAAARVRELAFLSALPAGGVAADDVASGLADPATEVRTAAASRLPALAEPRRRTLARVALADPWAQVRLDAVRTFDRAPLDAEGCRLLMGAAAHDADTGVRLAALDALARPCPDRGPQMAFLLGTARALPASHGLDWHAPAHALVSLAGLDRGWAAPLVRRNAGDAVPWVRLYAARAAGNLEDRATLHELADDPVPNVRTEAIRQLARLEERDADTLLVRVLAEAGEPQLVLTAAQLLGDRAVLARRRGRDRATWHRVKETAVATLARVSAEGKETFRDPRLALLRLIRETGDAGDLEALEPYLRDYDPAAADTAAAVMHDWSGESYRPEPRPPARIPLPTPDDLRAMERGRVVLHMARGGDIEIRLLPLVAPSNAWRLYRQARDGVLDGLTFHRVVPNFVIQGGSPDANEYAGHGAFTRDELGLPVQWRGTVGLSTRGRDTGDGQFYVNLVDNVRLDHDYTVLGVVISGMDVVDAVLEGDVIERAEVRQDG